MPQAMPENAFPDKPQGGMQSPCGVYDRAAGGALALSPVCSLNKGPPMIRFVPQYLPLVWGGRRLQSDFGRMLPDGPVGESWELVELPERESVAAQEGPHAGEPIGALWRAGVLGGSAQGAFPFLLKWIDAAQNLSVQVHPPQKACQTLGFGRPKTEAWYVAGLSPRAVLMMGHYPGFDATTLKLAASGGSLGKWLYETRPREGDIFFLESGTVHAIGEGCLLLEVQQPSDTTFRIYDWGRVGLDGKPRQLHLDEAATCIDFAKHGALKSQRDGVVGPCFSMRPLMSDTPVPPERLRVFVADRGPAQLRTSNGSVSLQRGDVAVGQPQDGPMTLVSGSAVLLGEP
jgi:mannose-6-phosphate isomerase